MVENDESVYRLVFEGTLLKLVSIRFLRFMETTKKNGVGLAEAATQLSGGSRAVSNATSAKAARFYPLFPTNL